MKRLLLAFFFTGLLGFGAAQGAEDKPAAKSNVLFIAIDDLRDWVGYLGNKQVKTPNLDKLAARGVHFTHGYCASPCCNPSRTALLTGPRPGTSGVYNNGDDWRKIVPEGTVTLPLVNEVQIGGMDELAAAHAIAAVLVAKGMLLHPQVSVLVTAYAGQDVSVLGEVARPGVYPYTMHHRLLDVISAAAGLAPSAGRLVNVFHRDDPKTPHPVVLDPSGTDTAADHNPEMSPGDTIQVSRAGLVYVIGDVVRPGGFPVDPAQGLTVVQALSLAWGPSQNAATGKGLLIREQNGGRTMTTLNLKRMLHGQDADQPIHDRDILFVPDSTARNLWNKTVESAIQSAIGVTIYSALVYSQRY